MADHEHAWQAGESEVCTICHHSRDWLYAEALQDRLADLEHENAALQEEMRWQGVAWVANTDTILRERQQWERERVVLRAWKERAWGIVQATAQLRVPFDYWTCPHCHRLVCGRGLQGTHALDCPVMQARELLAEEGDA
jgi:NMD protein affecting ribosome stability and mRNA decay